MAVDKQNVLVDTQNRGLRILVVIPCYNEALNLGALFGDIRKLNMKVDSLVVDDGSTDDTYRTAAKLSATLRLVSNVGIGAAVQTGIRYARDNGYDLCIQVDGDGQHPPEGIRTLVQNYMESPADLLIGSRFLMAENFRSTRLRRFGIKIIATLIRTIFGLKITDPTSGFRLMDRKAIVLFANQYPHDFPEPVSAVVAFEHGLVIREIPMFMKARENGDSSIYGMKSVLYIVRVCGYLALIRLRRYF